MISPISDIIPVVAIALTVVVCLVVVHVQDIALAGESICIDLEGGILITFIRENVVFDVAREMCREIDADLARVDTRPWFDAVDVFLGENGRFPVWIGKRLASTFPKLERFCFRFGRSRANFQYGSRQVLFR